MAVVGVQTHIHTTAGTINVACELCMLTCIQPALRCDKSVLSNDVPRNLAWRVSEPCNLVCHAINPVNGVLLQVLWLIVG